MRWRFILSAFALPFISAVLPAPSQVTHSAEEGNPPFTVGGGFSNFSDDWGNPNPRQNGITLWVDWRVPHLPSALQGLGVELEGRDISWNTPSYLGSHRMDTALAGPTYQWRHGRIRPLAKYLIGIGSLSITNPRDPTYQHDTRTVFAPAAGLDLRLWNGLLVRGEYEYQFWHDIFGHENLNPQGFTIGFAYDFGVRPSNEK